MCSLYTNYNSMCRDDASEASHAVDERASTYRLLEPISHPSRAEDLEDLRRLQKSSTKPRKGEHAGGSFSQHIWPSNDLPERP